MGWWGHGITQGDGPQDIILRIERYLLDRKAGPLAQIDFDELLLLLSETFRREEDSLYLTVAYYMVSRGVALPEDFKHEVVDELNYLIEATRAGDIVVAPHWAGDGEFARNLSSLRLAHLQAVLQAIEEGDAELLQNETRRLEGLA